MTQSTVCLHIHLTDEFCQDNMCNVSKPVLPKIAIKQQLDSDLEFFLVISQLLICAGLPGFFNAMVTIQRIMLLHIQKNNSNV